MKYYLTKDYLHLKIGQIAKKTKIAFLNSSKQQTDQKDCYVCWLNDIERIYLEVEEVEKKKSNLATTCWKMNYQITLL